MSNSNEESPLPELKGSQVPELKESPLLELKYADQLRLKIFLRDADAVIAAERGLNSACRLKLEALAQQQRLPERLKQLAFEQLQAGSGPEPLNRYEQAFADFLQTEFQQISGRLLSSRAEQKAIWLAESKYQLTPLRADQIIAQQAKLAGIERLSHSDARDYAIQFLHEQVGQLESLPEATVASLRERLIVLGMPAADIEHNLAYRLHSNRLQRQKLLRKQLWKRLAWSAALVGLIALLAGGYWAVQIRQANSPHNHGAAAASSELESNRPTVSSPAESPVLPGSSPRRTESESRAAAQRDQMEQLLIQIRDSGMPDSESLELARRGLLEETDDAVANEMLGPIWDALSPAASGPLPTVEQLKSQYAANQLAASLFQAADPATHATASDERWENGLHKIGSLTGVSPWNLGLKEYLNRSEQQIAVSQWTQLIQQTWQQPREVAFLIKPLTVMTQSRLPPDELHRLRSRSLKTLLEAHSVHWTHLQNELTEVIASADELELTEWLSLARRTLEPGLLEFVGRLLIDRFSPQLRPDQRLDVKTALGAIDDWLKHERSSEMRLRWEQVDRGTLLLLDDVNRSGRTLGAIHLEALTQLVNLKLQLSNHQYQRSLEEPKNYEPLDLKLADLQKKLENMSEVPLEVGLRLADRRPPPTLSERKRFSSALQTLANPSPEGVDSRIRAMDELEKLADKFSDLAYDEAQGLAAYLFAASDAAEELNIQRRIKSFRHWLTLGLAIQDELAWDPPLTERGAILIRLFFQIDCQLEDPNVHRQLIAVLVDQMELQRNQSASNWNQLDAILGELYRERMAILGLPSAAGDTPGTIEALLAAIAATGGLETQPDVDSPRDRRRLESFLTGSPLSTLEQAVLANTYWLDLQQKRNGNLSLASNQLSPEMASEISELEKKWSAPNVGETLFLTELRWLQLASHMRVGTADLVVKPVGEEGATQ